MPHLDAAQLVSVWERGKTQPDALRALAVLREAAPDCDPAALRALPLGERNARLLAVRRATFGPQMRAFVKCPRCSEPLEFEQDIDELLARHEPGAATAFELVEGDLVVNCRLSDGDDHAFAAELFFEEDVSEALIDRAITAATRSGMAVPPAQLGPALRAQIAEELARRDPLARPTIALGCAACEHVWSAPFDIGAFLWTEIERTVRAALDDVITLARGYGWREGDILAMSAARRQFYLQALE